MSTQQDLLIAVRSGQLPAVRAALDAGANLDDEGEPGLLMGLACFFGHVPVVRELVTRGAKVNVDDNALPTSPLQMAIKGGKKEVVRLLIELGAVLPEGVQTGLTDQEVTVAQWIAFRDGYAQGDAAKQAEGGVGEVEEIQLSRPSHFDTQLLEAETLRAVLSKNGQR